MREIVGQVTGPKPGETPREIVFSDDQGPLLKVRLSEDPFFFPHLLVMPIQTENILELVSLRQYQTLHPLLEQVAKLAISKESTGWFDPSFMELCRDLGIASADLAPRFPPLAQTCGNEIIAAMNDWFCRHAGGIPDVACYSLATGIVKLLRGEERKEAVISKARLTRDTWTPEGLDLILQIRRILARHGFLDVVEELPAPERG